MQSLGLSFILVLSKDSEAITAVGQSCYVYVGESGYMHTPNVDMVKENVEGCVCSPPSNVGRQAHQTFIVMGNSLHLLRCVCPV